MIKMKSFLNRSKRANSGKSKSSENGKSTKNKAQSKEKMNENKENLDAAAESMIGNTDVCGTDSDASIGKPKANGDIVNPSKENLNDIDLINKILPKELIIRVFSYMDIISLCRCAQVSKVNSF